VDGPDHASDRNLAAYDLAPTDFPLVSPGHSLIDTAKVAALGGLDATR
jgi:hypothetical protein